MQFFLSISYFEDLTLKLWKSLHHYRTKQKKLKSLKAKKNHLKQCFIKIGGLTIEVFNVNYFLKSNLTYMSSGMFQKYKIMTKKL